ncbi:MAG TPA: ATP-binding protein, partial [Gemmatimonadaceae bacterium]|nr:ATP-binding protein [Gemmatimonadaceae bacterium]
NRDLAALNAVLSAAADEAEPDLLLERACRELTALLGVPYAVAGMLDEAGTSIVVRADAVPAGEKPFCGLVLAATDAGVRAFLGETKAIVSSSALDDPRLSYVRPLFVERGVTACLALPLVSEGMSFGAIAVLSRTPREFTPHEADLAMRIGGQVALALARHRASAAAHLLRSTIEQVRESVFITNANYRMVYVNSGFSEATGVSRDAALGHRPRDVLGERVMSPQLDDIVAFVQTGRAWTGRIVLSRGKGRPLTFDGMISPIRDVRGAITHHLGIMRDISDDVEREEQLRHSQKLEAVGQLAGGVAHDFNNVLGAIMLQLEYLETQLDDRAGTLETLRELRASADRASRLPRQLLAFSRRQSMNVATHDLNVIVAELLRMVRRLIGERVTVSFTPGNASLPFSGDAGMIEQVVVNLCVNARDAMESGGKLLLETRRVEIADDGVAAHPGGRAGSFVELSVTDTGTGMSADVMAHIFEPFYTTKPVGRGTGLGLATTHGIVAQHQGWIEVESTEGHGSTFRVFLPLAAEAVSAAPAADNRPRPRGNATVLVAEDEDVLRRIIVRSLRSVGYTVIEATDAASAERAWAIAGGAIDVLLADVVMPDGVSGLGLAAKLRELEPALGVVLMSGYNVSGAPNVRFLKKPFNLTTLADTIGAANSEKEKKTQTEARN